MEQPDDSKPVVRFDSESSTEDGRSRKREKIVAFFCSESTGHLNPMLAMSEALSAEGWQVHFYAPKSVREKVEEAGGIWRAMGSDGLDIFQMAHAVVERLGEEKPYEIDMLPFRVVPATVGFMPYLLASVSALDPQFLVYDSCTPWAWLLSEILHIPAACVMSALPMSMELREKTSATYSEAGIKILDACCKTIRVAYGIDYNHNYSYTQYSPYTIVCASRAWHCHHEAFPRDQFRYWGPLICKRKVQGSGVESVSRLLSDTSIGRGGTQPLVFCSLGTVMTGCAYAIVGQAVEDFYLKTLEAAKMLPHVTFILSVGRNSPVTEEVHEGMPRISHIFGRPIPGNVTVARSVDQPTVLRRANIFITHCGQNSSSEAIVAAVPVLVAPFFGDQIENSKRFVELGIGLESSYLKDLKEKFSIQWDPDYDRVTASSLAEKMSRLLSEASFAESAEAFLKKQNEELGTTADQLADLVHHMDEANHTTVRMYSE
eukprot:TRINITY_DN74830_c0_g1_i1.p1 TRINITY_DN74830_c0_g1~~TRINITY_DN74830_c0_g1_i1.p1  ORF type:complete len:488 (+),score=80.18 TRINITY_DN74830_c0_g1_i1:79-1542(+)